MPDKSLGTTKEIERLAREARRAGWTVEVNGANHIRWTPPLGPSLTTSLTPKNESVTIRRIRKAIKQQKG